MPYSVEHKQKSRSKILTSAFELFAHHGYDAITIDNITEHAGLTRGAFYSHFSSKQGLYSESMMHAAVNSTLIHKMENEPHEINTLIALIENYLSHKHLINSQPCPLAFLTADVANKEPQVRDTYTHIFKGITQKIVQLLGGNKLKRQKQEKSLALTAMMIGGVAVSRALNDEKLTNQVMKACRSYAIEMIKDN